MCISDDVFDPVHRLFGRMFWLTPDFAEQAVGYGAHSNVALLRLLASYSASALKVAEHGNSITRAGVENMASDRLLRCWTVCRRALVSMLPLQPREGKRGREAWQTGQQATAAAAVSAALFLLLPRLAVSPTWGAATTIDTLVFALMNCCLKFGPERSLRMLASCHAIKLMHGCLLTVMGSNAPGRTSTYQIFDTLGDFAAAIAHLANQVVTQGCQGASAGSTALRNLLAGPLLRLLRSPLLDLLARLQHVPSSGSWATDLTSSPDYLPPWGLVPLHQMPGTMQPDAASAPIVMQVRGLGLGLEFRAWVGLHGLQVCVDAWAGY